MHFSPSKRRDFRKLHLASECRQKEKPIYSWILTSALRHDSPKFRTLLKRIHGRLGDVCGDKALSCRKNADLVAKLGGKPFLMPKKNASFKARGYQAWKEMMKFWNEHKKSFEKRYHKRSNCEAVNSSLKWKYGEFLYSRKWNMQRIEAGLKVITYNIRQLIRFRIRWGIEIWD
jgi:transposase